jgi:Mg2+-importing ATPase
MEASTIRGLTSSEASERLASFGANDPAPRTRRNVFLQFLGLFLNPLVLILLASAVLSIFLGEAVNAYIIIAMVLLGLVINFVQTFRSDQAVERLRGQVAPTATVLRDGEWREIHRHDVVPGDVIRLAAGDLVPADAELIESRDLYVQQAALTGESMPVEKEAQVLEPGTMNLTPESLGSVFLGTSVVSGTGVCRVISTGSRTIFGSIAQRLTSRPPESEFERGLRQFGMLILRAVVFLVLFILVVSLALHRDPFQSLLFAVALAVGLTPEFLPMITSVTLARGAMKMAHRKVIVKQLAAIQNFGSINVLCSDKTGTLTTGKMTLDQSLDPFGAASDRALDLAWVNSRHETGIRSPLDEAILLHDRPAMADYHKRDEIPFDFDRRRLSVVVEKSGAGDVLLFVTKGAPENVISQCVAYEQGGATTPLDAGVRAKILDIYAQLSREGFRVLAVAYRETPPKETGFTVADERDLVMAGFLAFADPLIEDAAEVIENLRRDGIQFKIVTGDSALVTAHVCKQVGLIDGGEVITGDDIAGMTDTALQHVVENSHAFARVSPSQKTRILLALRRRGHVVGFMGDGINDAPSLHSADVGISVSTAVDVARDAAEIILVEPGLRVLHEGVIEGRKAFGNVTKYLLMGTSSNFGNMFSMAFATLFLPFLPMLPTQILLNNFLYDLAQITIPSDNVDEEYLRQPQRWDTRLIRNFMVLIGPISSLYDFLTFWVLLQVFHASEELFHTGWFMESLATQTLVLFIIRTRRNPLQSRPSRALAATTLAIVAVGMLIPFTRAGSILGFVPPAFGYFAFLAAATVTYLLLVEIVKRELFRRWHLACRTSVP